MSTRCCVCSGEVSDRLETPDELRMVRCSHCVMTLEMLADSAAMPALREDHGAPSSIWEHSFCGSGSAVRDSRVG